MEPSPPRVLVVNSGSSSLKYAVVNRTREPMVADGIVERIGDGPVADHGEALRVAFEQLAESGQPLDSLGLCAVGHRVVHGGPDLYQPTTGRRRSDRQVGGTRAAWPPRTTRRVCSASRSPARRCPACRISLSSTRRSSTTCRAAAATYAIDRNLAQRWNIRRYGFHGTSHQYVSEQAAPFRGTPLESLNQIVLTPGQRGVGVRDCRRQTCRHVDGH